MNRDDIKKLHAEAIQIAKKHRESQINLGFHLLEIDRRKLWWKKGYSSLYNYCEQKFKLDPETVDEILEVTLKHKNEI
jgi:hypothetical protein